MLVLMALEDMMSDLGCTSITVDGNLEEALALVDAQPFDLATLDVNLHGKRSYPIADALNDAGVPSPFPPVMASMALTNAMESIRCSTNPSTPGNSKRS